jgi:hypothetical protein
MAKKGTISGTKPASAKPGPAPKLQPDPTTLRLVRAIAGVKATQREAAFHFGVALSTFEDFLAIPAVREAWDGGQEGDAFISLRRNQFELSKKHPQMAIHLGKVYLGQKDEHSLNLSGSVDTGGGVAVTLAERIARELGVLAPAGENEGDQQSGAAE